MASKYAGFEAKTIESDEFTKVEKCIHSTFEQIIKIATERRDQLLVQLSDIKLEYLSKENTRKKHLLDLEKLVKHLNEMSIEQNLILKLQEEHVLKTKKEIRRFEQPTAQTFPVFSTDCLQSLLQQLEKFGCVRGINLPYNNTNCHVKRFGTTGNKKGEFNLPLGITIDEDKRIYVADNGNGRIQVFSPDAEFQTEFGKDQLISPHSIAIYDRWILVSDCIQNKIFKFNKINHKLVGRSLKEDLNNPSGITVDSGGEILIADCDNNRISVCNLELKFISEIGRDALKFPEDVKIISNKIFVADHNKVNNLHIFSKSGDLLQSLIKLACATSYIFMCVDINTNIIITDSSGKSIQIFTMGGDLIQRIDCKNKPRGIAVTENCNIICASHNDFIDIY